MTRSALNYISGLVAYKTAAKMDSFRHEKFYLHKNYQQKSNKKACFTPEYATTMPHRNY